MDPTLSSNFNLDRLQYWLNFELSGGVLFFISFFSFGALPGLSFMRNFVLYALLVAILLFTPFMLKVLFQENRYGWIIFFGILVVLPACIIYLYFRGTPYGLFLTYIPIALFILYCLLLKLTIPSWID